MWEMANCRANSEIVVVTRLWVNFDLIVFKVTLGSFSALVSKWPLTQKGLAVK